MGNKILADYLDEFVKAFKVQLEEDQKRWQNTWKTRPREGQEHRVYARYGDYYDQFKYAGVPIPWLKIVGEAFISWVRENYPDYADK